MNRGNINSSILNIWKIILDAVSAQHKASWFINSFVVMKFNILAVMLIFPLVTACSMNQTGFGIFLDTPEKAAPAPPKEQVPVNTENPPTGHKDLTTIGETPHPGFMQPPSDARIGDTWNSPSTSSSVWQPPYVSESQ